MKPGKNPVPPLLSIADSIQRLGSPLEITGGGFGKTSGIAFAASLEPHSRVPHAGIYPDPLERPVEWF